MLSAKGLDELNVLGLSARLVENAKVSLALVKGLGALAETAGESVVDHGLLEDLLLTWKRIARAGEGISESSAGAGGRAERK